MTWTTNTDSLANTAVNCMAIDPGNSNILYAGTGEGFPAYWSIQGNGIFKTLDGGASWEHLPSTRNNPDFRFVNRLAISPNDSWLLLAAVRVEPPPPANTFGKILRSTNGGATWTTTLTSSAMADVRFQPDSIVANIPNVPGVNCVASSLDGHVYYSTDHGASWTTRADNLGISPPAGFARVELAYSRSNPLIVYASKPPGTGIGGELFRSEDGGFSFTSRGQIPDPHIELRAYNNVLWVDPFDPETVLVGGVYMHRTTDGGVTWVHAGSGTHLDHHALVEDPAYDHETPSNRILYGGNDGGVYRTTDILAQSPQWTSLNNSLGVTQFYGAAGHNATGTIIGGTQDNGTIRFRDPFDPEDWDMMAFGDGGYCAVDQSATPAFYGENFFLEIYRNTQGGGGFKPLYIWGGPGHPNGIPTGECGNVPCANFIAPFVMDPNLDQQNEQKTLMAGGRSLWRTIDARVEDATQVAWTEVKSRNPPNCTDFCINISAVAVAEGASNIIWVGDNIGSVFYTTNGTATSPTWNPGDPNNLLPGGGQTPNDRRMCTRLTIAPPLPGNPPDVARTVYATFAGFYPSTTDTRGNVWKKGNDGIWTDIHRDLPSAPAFSLVISPSNPDFLYLGTEVGVFASPDGGDTWSPAFGGSSADTLIYSLVVSAGSTSSPDIIYAGTEEGVFASKDDGETWAPGFGGPANARVAELFWMVTGQTRKLIVATHGRGMFTLTAVADD